jgi:hypothetical protein
MVVKVERRFLVRTHVGGGLDDRMSPVDLAGSSDYMILKVNKVRRSLVFQQMLFLGKPIIPFTKLLGILGSKHSPSLFLLLLLRSTLVCLTPVSTGIRDYDIQSCVSGRNSAQLMPSVMVYIWGLPPV